MNQAPSIGRIVHVALPEDSPNKGEHRAALITGVGVNEEGIVSINALVYFDKVSDIADAASFHPFGRFQCAKFDESGAPGTWHWPERTGEPLGVSDSTQANLGTLVPPEQIPPSDLPPAA